MIVLDTNVIWELMSPSIDRNVERWVESKHLDLLFITSITKAEILFGMAIMPEGKRKHGLLLAADGYFSEDFSGRILPFDGEAAEFYGAICANRRAGGRPISQLDAQIASIARSRGATVATRNVTDFIGCGIEVINPWDV